MPANDVLVATVLVIIGVGGSLIAAPTRLPWLEWIGKPLASAAFVGLAVSRAGASAPERWFLLALAFCVVGDIALLGRSTSMFLAGLGAFLLGHVGFLGAFLSRGVDPRASAMALVPLSIIFVTVWRWLLPHVRAGMRGPVVAYMVVITAMVACAFGTHAMRAAPAWVVAAVAFFISDLAVARRRFVAPDGINRLWGLPLYYGAQLVFAAHIGQ